MTIDEMIAVLQAAKKGKKCERKLKRSYRDTIDNVWYSFDQTQALEWAFSVYVFRVAPEPRERWFPDGVALGGPYGGLMGETTEDNCLMRWPDCKPVLFREVL